MLYIIYWNDETKEIYETKSERSARIHTLENQGYEIGEDFSIWTE